MKLLCSPTNLTICYHEDPTWVGFMCFFHCGMDDQKPYIHRYIYTYNVGPSSYKLVYLVYLVMLSTNLAIVWGPHVVYLFACELAPHIHWGRPETLPRCFKRDCVRLKPWEASRTRSGAWEDLFFTKPTWFIWLTNMVNKVKTCFFQFTVVYGTWKYIGVMFANLAIVWRPHFLRNQAQWWFYPVFYHAKWWFGHEAWWFYRAVRYNGDLMGI